MGCATVIYLHVALGNSIPNYVWASSEAATIASVLPIRWLGHPESFLVFLIRKNISLGKSISKIVYII